MTLAQRMADDAGTILRQYFKAALKVDQKADSSPVTLADREVESTLRVLIENHYPEHGIVGEEFGNVRSESVYQWVIDPIDGTRAFIEGTPTFTTLIALVMNRLPILGIIDNPITKERWTGVLQQNSQCNGKRIKTSNITTMEGARLATTSMDYFTKVQVLQFDQLKRQVANVTFGGDAYAYAKLASGDMDIVVDAGMKPYDFCALPPVIEGAGGIITDWEGNPLSLASDGRVLAAANQELHAQALVILNLPLTV